MNRFIAFRGDTCFWQFFDILFYKYLTIKYLTIFLYDATLNYATPCNPPFYNKYGKITYILIDKNANFTRGA
jgi:hypothetical protein